MYELIKEYEYRLQNKDPKLRTVLVKKMLIPLTSVGWFRHVQYYESKITRLIIKLFIDTQEDLKNVRDSAIVTFDSVKTKNLVLNKKRFVPDAELQPLKLEIVPAISVGNTIYSGMHITRQTRRKYIAVSYSLSALLLAVTMTLTGLIRWGQVSAVGVQRTLSKQKVLYYVFFILIMFVDAFFSPLLYVFTRLERHYSYAEQQRSLMLKLYFYWVGNVFSMLYSRNIEQISETGTFLTLIEFAVPWRCEFGGGAFDVFSFVMLEIILFNLIDVMHAWLKYAFFRSIAHTPKQLRDAQKKNSLNLTSMFVNLAVFLTVLLSVCSAYPLGIFYALIYFPIASVAYRYLVLFFCSPMLAQGQLGHSFEIVCIIATFISWLVFGCSYLSVSSRSVALWTLLGFLVLGILVVLLYHPKCLYAVLKHYFPDLCVDSTQKSAEQENQIITQINEFQYLYDEDVTAQEIRTVLNKLRQVYGNGEYIKHITVKSTQKD